MRAVMKIPLKSISIASVLLLVLFVLPRAEDQSVLKELLPHYSTTLLMEKGFDLMPLKGVVSQQSVLITTDRFLDKAVRSADESPFRKLLAKMMEVVEKIWEILRNRF